MTLLGTYYTYYYISGSNTPISTGDFRFYFQVYLNNQDYVNNKSNIHVKSYIQFANGWVGGAAAYAGISINSGSYTDKSVITSTSGGTQLINTYDFPISHNSDGSGYFTFRGRGRYLYEWIYTANPTITLPTIPRYTTINSFSVSTNGLTSLKVSWSAANTCDRVEYSLNGGSWITAQTGDRTSGTFYINDLTPGTTYSVKIRVRRKDSQLYTESSTKSATTTDIARITSSLSNIDSDSSLTVVASKPDGVECDIKLELPDLGLAEVIRHSNTTNTTFTIEEIQSLANYIPNNTSTTLRITAVTVIDGVDKYWDYKDITYSVVNANPIFNNFTYEDTDTSITALTGDNQIIVKGYSDLKVTISTSNKAVAQKGATMDKYRLVVGSKQIDVDYSDSSDVNLMLSNIDNNVFTVYAIDSRGNSTAKQISPSTYIDYFEPYITSPIPTATRTNGIDSETTLSFSGKFFNDSFGAVNNSLTITYEYKKTSESTWTTGTTTITPTINGNNFSFSGLIAGDLEANGFDQQYSYNIRLIISDEITSIIYDGIVLGTGKPNLAIHREGVAINQPYDENLGGALQVNGGKVLNILEIYPIGSIYMSVNSTNPAEKFGGTWVQLTDRFLIGAGSTYGVGATGGSTLLQSHNHTGGTSANGQHNHSLALNEDSNYVMYGTLNWGATYTGFVINSINSNGPSSGKSFPLMANYNGNHSHTFTTNHTGGGNAENMPPYRGVYMWYRSA